MGDFEAIISNLNTVEVIEEALYNLEAVLEDEGLIHTLEAEKCLSVLKGLSKGEVVHTLDHLLSDSVLLEETLLKVHYIYQLTKTVTDRKINLTSLVISLKDVTTQSIKFLTPRDISFIYSTIPSSKLASGAQSAAKQIDHIKTMKEELITKTTELVKHDTIVRDQLEKCNMQQDLYMSHILDSIKGRFVSSEYSTVTSSPPDSTAIVSTPPSGGSSSGDLSKSTSARLDTQLNKTKLEKQVKVVGGKAKAKDVEKKVLHALLNKTAEEHISRLEYDEAYESLLAEVNKLEKKFVAQKTNKGEMSLKKRMNELLLRQIEFAEERRALNDATLRSVMEHTLQVQEGVNQQRLDRALTEAHNSELKVTADLKASQEQFDYNLMETEEYFNNLLLDINATRIIEMQKTNSVSSKKLENETRMLVSDKTQFEGKHRMYEQVSDELFDKLKADSKEMMDKFEKVYKTTEEIIEENRNVDVSDKRKMRNRKVPIQTELTELYTDIHSMEHNFAENPILDFEMELSRVCDDHDANSLQFLNKSDGMYKQCQETYMNIVLKRYGDAAK
jgi:hypothetical protein